MRLIALAPLVWAQAAAAQTKTTEIYPDDFGDNSRPQGVRDRIADEFRPIGGRSGSFFLYPEVMLTANGTSNVRATPDDGKEDAFLDAVARIRVVRPSPDSRLQFVGEVGQTLHAEANSENRTRLLARGFYRAGAENRSHFDLTGLAARRFIARRDINNAPDARAPVELGVLQADAAYVWRLNRFSLTVGGSVFDLNYKDARSFSGTVIDQDFRDNLRLSGSAELRYALSPDLALVGRGSYAVIDYDFGPGSPAFDITSDIDRDSDVWRVEGGFGIALTDRLTGSATIGYSRRTFDSRTNAPRDSGGLSFSGDLAWQANPSTTIRFAADRSFIESASPVIAGYQAASFSIGVDHSPAPRLVLGFNARLQDFNPIGASGNRTEYGGGAEATYYLTRRYQIIGGVSYAGRDTGFASPAFDEFAGRLGLRATF